MPTKVFPSGLAPRWHRPHGGCLQRAHGRGQRTRGHWRRVSKQVAQLARYMAQHSRDRAVLIVGDTNLEAGRDREALTELQRLTGCVDRVRYSGCGDGKRLDRLLFRSSPPGPRRSARLAARFTLRGLRGASALRSRAVGRHAATSAHAVAWWPWLAERAFRPHPRRQGVLLARSVVGRRRRAFWTHERDLTCRRLRLAKCASGDPRVGEVGRLEDHARMIGARRHDRW